MVIESVRLIPRELRNWQFPEARFLNKDVQTKYEDLCRPFGEKASESLNVGINGSNLFKVLLLNQSGIRTATLQELDLLAEFNPEFLRGTYEDVPTVVLRSAGDSYAENNYLAKGLAKLIKQRSFTHAFVIEGLKLKEDENSVYGLSFEKGERFKAIKAPAFDHVNHKKRFSRINPDYSIDFAADGKRTFYTKSSGLSGLYLNRNLYADSEGENLADSNGCGRVVLVSA